MSSIEVRQQIKSFIAANSSENVIDLTAEFEELRELLSENGLQPDAPWLGIEFIGDSELPVSLAATNDQGLYREIGSVVLHVCAEGRLGVGDSLLARGEILRNLFRGRRIGSVVVEGVTPMNFGPGATLEFEGGYVSGSITLSYYQDLTPGV